MFSPVTWPLPDLVTRRTASTPDRTALVDAGTGESWTYRELSTGPVGGLAGGLAAWGVAPGDHLGVIADPGPRLAALVHAAARVGCRLVPLAPDAPAPALAARCEAAAVTQLLVPDGADAKVTAAFDGPVASFDDVADGGPAVVPAEWGRDDDQWLVFTSGTTGSPRPVRLTAGNLVASATASARRLGVRPTDRWLACLPMHHVGGLAPVVRTALYGTAVVVQRGFDVEATAAAMADHDVTHVSLVPTMLARLLDGGWTPPERLRCVLLGGAPAPEALVERCEAAAVPVCPTYGMTETASQLATAHPTEAFAHPGTVGRPLHGVELAVLDATGRPVPPGEPGELVVSGPNVSPGYFGAEAAAAERFVDGAFRTHDRGRLDDGGRLRVLGRLDDAIHTGGETVQPADVESVLCDHAGVERAAVVGLPDEEWGEVVGALVVPTAGASFDPSALRDHCRARLEPPAVPKVVVPADALPRTASGTVDRPSVRERLGGARRHDGI